MRRTSLAAALACVAGSCSPVHTEVLIVIDSDMLVPEELDEVRVDLIGPSGETRRSEGSIVSRGDLPRTLGIVDATGGARMVRVTVTGMRRHANVLQRRAAFSFAPNETRILRLDLLRSCVGVSCGSDETCGDNGCRPITIATHELVPYDESMIDPPDAGSLDAAVRSDAGCVTQPELCNGLDDDCDGMEDEDFDLESDMQNCGECGNACPSTPSSASSVCEGGRCVLRCDRDFDDCNGRLDDGCEASLAQPAHCGSCLSECSAAAPYCMETLEGLACASDCGADTLCDGSCVALDSDPLHCGACETECPAPPNASASCVERACEFVCDEGFEDCDTRPENGCESNLRELDNCGRCGLACARPNAIASCASGACELVECDPLRGDCDGMPENGCEEDLSTNLLRCGACETECPTGVMNGAMECAGGMCRLACDPGFGSCDSRIDNGCEQSVADPSACGACGVSCLEPEPLCASLPEGGYACAAGCGTGTLCGESCVDTQSDATHCNGCDIQCASGMNASPICTAGACSLRCDPGFDDCDAASGCETTVALDVSHCGECDNACSVPPYSTATCSDGTCGFRCDAGRADCTGGAADGCEIDTSSDPAHCGSCGTVCTPGAHVSTVGCADGACVITSCRSPREDCDGNFSNGCETKVNNDENNCGGCGIVCGPGQRCRIGLCE
jgi:hypothetical protein